MVALKTSVRANLDKRFKRIHKIASRKVYAREASKQFVDHVYHQISACLRQERKANNFQKARFSHHEWSHVSQGTMSLLEEK
eukprot:6544407-Ditylum_brightwellii.AAC.1